MDKHTVILGLGYGDEGKGTAVDWLCHNNPDVRAVIRYNGGAQAAHNVVLPEGTHHTFAQLGSGSFHHVPTHLSKYMLVNPMNLMREAHALSLKIFRNPLEMLTVSEDALLITDYHREANRIKSRRQNYGTCAQGIGETRGFALKNPDAAPTVGDLRRPGALKHILQRVKAMLEDELGESLDDVGDPRVKAGFLVDAGREMNIVPDEWVNHLLMEGPCVFEGAQGVLLDETYGFAPHTTWTDTTARNARAMLGAHDSHTIGVSRTYMTRHGHGPFPSEADPARVGTPSGMEELHNAQNEWQGGWRVGFLDLSLLEYAVRATQGVDEIMLTHCDRVPGDWSWETTYGYMNWWNQGKNGVIPLPASHHAQEDLRGCTFGRARGYNYVVGVDTIVQDVGDITGVTPSIFSYGPTYRDKTRELVNVVA